MPKKFKGENTKSAQARAVKAARAADAKAQKEKEIEDAYWRDDDKHVARKLQRKDDQEKKRTEKLELQKERQKLYEEEMAAAKAGKPAPVSAKITRHQIEAHKQMEAASKDTTSKKMRNVTVLDDEAELEENINRTVPVEGEARSVEDAIGVLTVKDPELDKHPEKRMKAAYTAFEDKNLPILKAENPNMRLSQLKQILKKDWMKSPENPLNQRTMAYNAKKSS